MSSAGMNSQENGKQQLPTSCLSWSLKMRKEVTITLYIVLLVAVVVSVDFLFFRNEFWERLIANIGIVLVFAAFYLRFLKRP